MDQRETSLTVEAALVLPVEGADFNRACRLTDEAVTAAETSKEPAPVFTIKALAEYRRGQFKSACDWADRAINAKKSSVWVIDDIIQAAAFAKLGQMDAARTSFAKGNQGEYSVRPSSLQDFWDGNWYEWIFADHLRREIADDLRITQPPASINPQQLRTKSSQKIVPDTYPNTDN